MNLDKLKYVINEDGIVNVQEKEALFASYKELFKEIYGYDILSKYEKNKKKNNNSYVFEEAFIKSIDVLKSVQEDENLSLLMIYDENNNIIGFGRIKKIVEIRENNPIISAFNSLVEKHLNMSNEKKVSVPDLAIVPGYSEYKYDIWKRAINIVEKIVTTQGFDRLYVEIPINSPLLFRADALGFIESPEDIPISTIPRTRILNKSLERNKDEEFNFSR